MANGDLNWIANYIWSIADDVLRDLYVRGKYRDVILPMAVLRRLDAVLADGKQAVLDMKTALDDAGIVEQDTSLRGAAGQAFYNTSKFTLSDLRSRASAERLEADFRDYLDGFSPNVQDILDCFEFRNQIPRLSRADALGTLVEKLTSPDVNLSPEPVRNTDGSVRHPGLDNHGMGTIFEELVRRFNEENNEEAGEHWTPRDAVKLMAQLVFQPIAGDIDSGTYLLYDGACGTGGMLTVAEETVQEIAAERGKAVSTHLYGQEINAETYAICKADLLLKGEGDAADNIVGGPEHSTLSNDAFPSHEFDFMLSNPPYGKSWKTDLERMGGKTGMRDMRFLIDHDDDPEYSLVTRSSDGQMLFLANKLSKMKTRTRLGSRIAEVHNGSSLFTGDAGQGESNIRRWIIENDWLEAIVALPVNMFYNTGIATYIWVLTNRKPEHRRGKVQLIDATNRFRPLRKNLGKKNCELGEEDIAHICETFLRFEESEESRIFDNAAFRLLEGDGRAAVADRRHRPGPRLPGGRDQGAERHGRTKRRRAAGHQEAAQALARRPIRCAAFSRPRSAASPQWSSTSRTRSCATPSRYRFVKTAASRPSSGARCCPTRLTPGTGPTRSRPATRSASIATSTSPSRCGRWRRSGAISWRWNAKRKVCWERSSRSREAAMRLARCASTRTRPYSAVAKTTSSAHRHDACSSSSGPVPQRCCFRRSRSAN